MLNRSAGELVRQSDRAYLIRREAELVAEAKTRSSSRDATDGVRLSVSRVFCTQVKC